MKTFVSFFIVFVPAIASAAEEGFTPLFDGKTLDGWVVKAEKEGEDKTWTIRDGTLVAQPGANWLSTREMYGDFVLRLEWKLPVNGNSGVFIHVPDLKAGEHPWEKGIEIQVLDNKGDQYVGKIKPFQFTGSIYGAVPAIENSPYKGADQWHSYEITCQGSRTSVKMNDQLVAEGDAEQLEVLKNRPRRGYIGLQNHGTAVEYRNIRIKVLK